MATNERCQTKCCDHKVSIFQPNNDGGIGATNKYVVYLSICMCYIEKPLFGRMCVCVHVCAWPDYARMFDETLFVHTCVGGVCVWVVCLCAFAFIEHRNNKKGGHAHMATNIRREIHRHTHTHERRHTLQSSLFQLRRPPYSFSLSSPSSTSLSSFSSNVLWSRTLTVLHLHLISPLPPA